MHERRRSAKLLSRRARCMIGTQKAELRRRKAHKAQPGGNVPSITDMGEAEATRRQFCLCAPIDAPFTERIHLNVSMERHYMSHALNGARRLAAVAGHCAGFK